MSRILIIEDEEAIADLEKDYLELSGFEVEICNRGDTGLTRALNEEFDLIILDLMLPEVDGFDICRQVREEKNTPIIMVSAKKDDIDKIRGLGLGADDYMTKPFSMPVLLKKIAAILRRAGFSKELWNQDLLLRYPGTHRSSSQTLPAFHSIRRLWKDDADKASKQHPYIPEYIPGTSTNNG